LKNIQIITFDEILEKLKSQLALLTSNNEPTAEEIDDGLPF
jgi:hypothetical protein